MNRKSTRQPSIVVLGDINVDIIGRVNAWPEPGEDCLAQKLEIRCGGVGANCAFGLARWGVAARLLGCVGQDMFSEYMLKILRAGNVDTRSVQRTAVAMTGMFYINVTPDGERTFFGGRGKPCAITVDSSATIGRPACNAAATSSRTNSEITKNASEILPVLSQNAAESEVRTKNFHRRARISTP